MDNAEPNESIFSELNDIIDFGDVGDIGTQHQIQDINDDTPAEITVKVRFKSGHEKDIKVNLPVESEIFDGTLTINNVLDYIGSAYAFTENAFLALPVDNQGSHVFIDISATDFVEVVR